MKKHPFIPSFGDIDWNDKGEKERRRRANIIVTHASGNSKRSEFAWEADAWHNVFGRIRNDPLLIMDKRSCYTAKPNHPASYPTNEDKDYRDMRVPDLCIGLASAPGDEANEPEWAQFDPHLLNRALLHPNYGLITDPDWEYTDLLFPFAVYEAKKCPKEDPWGTRHPIKKAYKQGSRAATTFLKMQAALIREPGAAHAYRKASPKSLGNGQVFIFVSEGSKWELHVGYWVRQPKSHFYTWDADDEKKVKLSRIWEGYLTKQKRAWELLFLVDAIHKWARTIYRPFIERHLTIWHKAVNRTFLLEWVDETSRSGVTEVRKRYEQERKAIEQERRAIKQQESSEIERERSAIEQQGRSAIEQIRKKPQWRAKSSSCCAPPDIRMPVWTNTLRPGKRKELSQKTWRLLVEAWEASGQL